jgi:hypothetical protein
VPVLEYLGSPQNCVLGTDGAPSAKATPRASNGVDRARPMSPAPPLSEAPPLAPAPLRLLQRLDGYIYPRVVFSPPRDGGTANVEDLPLTAHMDHDAMEMVDVALGEAGAGATPERPSKAMV